MVSSQQKKVDELLETAKRRAFGTADQQHGETKPDALQLADLFNLCSAQIKKYEYQTQSRAYWSFICAVVAMSAGIALLCWGAVDLFQGATETARTTGHIVSGSIISTVGGAMSAYITKTFLDVHRTSLLQLNHYFKQPVLNSHILSAQRLADRLEDGAVKKEMYRELIKQVIALIAAEQIESGTPNPHDREPAPRRNRSLGRAQRIRREQDPPNNEHHTTDNSGHGR
jgi:hypothetical protein